MQKPVNKILILGGGTAGWMTAAALAKVLGKTNVQIQLVESEQIGTVSVGEATIPQIRLFNQVLEIDENEFIQQTQGTFKLAIEFVDWWKKGHRYMHPFGSFGVDMEAVPFHHYWLKMYNRGKASELDHFSLAAMAAKNAKFSRPQNIANSPLSQIAYAFHFDAVLYAKYLRRYAQSRGVERIEGKMTHAKIQAESGFIECIYLESGQVLDADLFIDCSGFRALLIEKTLGIGYQDWSHWLPCDRAIAMPCRKTEPLLSYTRATAKSGGWQWRIPLQHRTGNGYVYASEWLSDDEAHQALLASLDNEPMADPNQLSWQTGRRNVAWFKNCIAIGLSSGFLEPLESTSIHLIQSSIARLMALFPSKEFRQPDIDCFNRHVADEMAQIRDFVILHYKATEREGSPLWQYCRNMTIPESLEHKIQLFRSHGRIFRENNELFNETSWLAVMHGQGIRTQGYHPLVDGFTEQEVSRRLGHIKQVIDNSLAILPDHRAYIEKHCAAPVLACA
jgi:tryptophan halogenase